MPSPFGDAGEIAKELLRKYTPDMDYMCSSQRQEKLDAAKQVQADKELGTVLGSCLTPQEIKSIEF